MTFHRERHAVLASNLANLDTPAFKPMDLVRVEDAKSQAPAMSTTDPRHLQAGQAVEGGTVRTETVVDGGETPGRDDNAVVLERELAKINANRVQYAASSELVSRRLAMLRYGATDGSV